MDLRVFPSHLLLGQRWGIKAGWQPAGKGPLLLWKPWKDISTQMWGWFCGRGFLSSHQPLEPFEDVCGGQRANPLGSEVSPPVLPAFLCSSPCQHFLVHMGSSRCLYPSSCCCSSPPADPGFGCGRPGRGRKRIQMLHSCF